MMLPRKKLRTSATALLTIALIVMPLLTTSASAQATTGGIRGVVSDANGAVVPNASVVATNIATGVEYKGTATGEGLYSIARIPPSRYRITVEMHGFKK